MKLCKDCRYARPVEVRETHLAPWWRLFRPERTTVGISWHRAVCLQPDAYKPERIEVEPVTGTEVHLPEEVVFCSTWRRMQSFCGPEGRFWEARP